MGKIRNIIVAMGLALSASPISGCQINSHLNYGRTTAKPQRLPQDINFSVNKRGYMVSLKKGQQDFSFNYVTYTHGEKSGLVMKCLYLDSLKKGRTSLCSRNNGNRINIVNVQSSGLKCLYSWNNDPVSKDKRCTRDFNADNQKEFEHWQYRLHIGLIHRLWKTSKSFW
ncbi:MAG: hypothetical protein U9Q69_03745 [Nanoarchaeota archaeon]|nr:hypothetical protein [Nanoarchaeota archaeon]